jgi:hypothetical protein
VGAPEQVAVHARQNKKTQGASKNNKTAPPKGKCLFPDNEQNTYKNIKSKQFRPSSSNDLDHFQPAMIFGQTKDIAAIPHDTIDYEQGKRAQPFSAWKK